MDYFPIFLDLKGRSALVVGGGEAASVKAAMLWRAGARVSIVAHTLGCALRGAVRRGEAIHLAAHFTPVLLAGMAVVIVADETLAVNETVSRAAQACAIPVNVVDEPALCSFIMPAVVDRSPLIVAISTAGKAPMLARLLRLWLERSLPERLGHLARLAGRLRPLVQRRLPDGPARRRFWEQVFTGTVAERALAGDESGASVALLQAIDDAQATSTRRVTEAA